MRPFAKIGATVGAIIAEVVGKIITTDDGDSISMTDSWMTHNLPCVGMVLLSGPDGYVVMDRARADELYEISEPESEPETQWVAMNAERGLFLGVSQVVNNVADAAIFDSQAECDAHIELLGEDDYAPEQVFAMATNPDPQPESESWYLVDSNCDNLAGDDGEDLVFETNALAEHYMVENDIEGHSPLPF